MWMDRQKTESDHYNPSELCIGELNFKNQNITEIKICINQFKVKNYQELPNLGKVFQ